LNSGLLNSGVQRSGFKSESSNVRSSKVHFSLGVQKSRDQKSGVQKFIFALGFKSPEFKTYWFKSSEFKSLGFKSSYLTWGSKVLGSIVRSSKIPFLHGVQKFWVQTSGFKSESSNVRGSNVPESNIRLEDRHCGFFEASVASIYKLAKV
jgi:hypothetical protein